MRPIAIPLCDAGRCVGRRLRARRCARAPAWRRTTSCSSARAAAIPGGVNSSIRAFKSVGGRPYVVARAEGAHLWDVEGTRYIDLVQSYGAVILGHAHPAITAAVAARGHRRHVVRGADAARDEARRGDRRARRSCEQVRFMNSGTEATSTAVRLARGYTGRDRVVIFHGNFHGATDALLAAGGSGVATLGLPGTAGVPAGRGGRDDGRAVQRGADARRDGRRVIVEPIAANMGVDRAGARVPRRAARRVRPGRRRARVRRGDHRVPGRRRAAPRRSTTCAPDLTTFGKVIGGGLPIGAVGGRREMMETLSPLGPVFHAGTLAGNPIATAAGLAALERARRRRLHRADGAGAAPGVDAARRVRGGRVRGPVPRRRHADRHVLRRRRSPDRLRRRQAHRRAGLRPLLPRHARRGRGDGARRLRGDLRRRSPTPTPCSTRSPQRPSVPPTAAVG